MTEPTPRQRIDALTDQDDEARAATRELLIWSVEGSAFLAVEAARVYTEDVPLDHLYEIGKAIFELDRESLTELALEHSLCPLHLCDYAICFDDERDECSAIRTIHPSHDT